MTKATYPLAAWRKHDPRVYVTWPSCHRWADDQWEAFIEMPPGKRFEWWASLDPDLQAAWLAEGEERGRDLAEGFQRGFDLVAAELRALAEAA